MYPYLQERGDLKQELCAVFMENPFVIHWMNLWVRRVSKKHHRRKYTSQNRIV
jgi:hypothetical protein